MATDKRLSKRTPDWVRREDSPGVRIDSGPFIGIIKNNNDPIRGGRLQVWIPDLGGDENNPKNWRTVGYASPFYGTTYQPKSSKNNKFNEVVHSYGMWAVPPDIGNQVICTFIAGDPNRGYWFACVNSDLSHYMVPGLAAGNNVDLKYTDPNIKDGYNKSNSVWPVTEFNQNNPANIKEGWINNAKPAHESQVNILINQGLDRDAARGGVTSSSQRESPSTVFGISTPGRPLNDPKDDPNYLTKVKSGKLTADDVAIKARKGGHTFVMDDGDQRGQSQLMRLRTAGGHQLLMNDSERILYLANSDGTVWMEFTGGGHINVYSRAGINMRTEGDFNIHADNNINIDSGGSIRMRAANDISSQSKTNSVKASTSLALHGGKITALSDSSLALQAASGSFYTTGELVLKGDKIQLNSTTPDTIAPTKDLLTYKQNDIAWDNTRGVWTIKSGVFESVATTTPTHEPWIRGAAASAVASNEDGISQFAETFEASKEQNKQSSLCEPQPPATNVPNSVAITGNTNEQLVESALKGYGITDTTQLAAIMAQCSHESGGFKYLRELGKDSYFAKYEGRADLGNTQTGDGLKYKGRGFIQITGRDLYTRAGTYLGIDLVNSPELAEDPKTAARLVLYFFFEYKKSRTATVNWEDVTAVTRIVNGGTNGLADRQNKFAEYKTRYTNGVMTSGSGSVVVDGSGRPITTGTAKLDPGPESARGKPVTRPAPSSTMTRTDAPSPGTISSTNNKIPGLVSTQLKALMLQIGYAESELDYTKVDTTRKMLGRYQINGLLLKSYGYVIDANDIITVKESFAASGTVYTLSKSPSRVTVEINGVLQPSSSYQLSGNTVTLNTAPPDSSTVDITTGGIWTGLEGIKSSDHWLKAAGVQEKVMEATLQVYYTKLVANGGIKANDDVCTVAGMISVAYFFREYTRGLTTGNPPDQAKFWREQATQKNLQGQPGEIAYNWGRYAIDVLSLISTEFGNTAPISTGVGQPTSVNINPDDVLIFTLRSGDRTHFNALHPDFKGRLLQAAKEYKEKSGRKLTISSAVRTQEEQTAIYTGWVNAGGKLPEKPTVRVEPYGNISRPVKTVGNHGQGIAADIGVTDAAEMEQLGILEKYGLYRFDPKGDPVHVQLKPEFRPTGLVTIQTLTKNG